MGRMSLRKIHRYKTNNMNIVELIKECPKYTKLYTITHGEVLFDHVEGNCIVVITETSNGFTKYLKLDELGRLSEHGQTVLFPSTSGTWDEFDITKIEINSPFVPGQVAYNEEFCSFGFADMNGVSLKTNEGQILPISRLATESEIDIWNQENHKKHLHYSLARKKYVYYFQPFDKVLVRNNKESAWSIAFFSHINPRNQECIYTIEGGLDRRYCIPYNEETEHLVGEIDDYEDEIEKIVKECKLTEGKLD